MKTGIMVFWLVVFNVYGNSGGTVIPVPYFEKEACEAALETVPRGACVPQPIEDVADWLIQD